MPHHHDWHHEGHKGCNYTFTSLGGLWDCKASYLLGQNAKLNYCFSLWKLILFVWKVFLELGRQGATQELPRRGKTDRWNLIKKRGFVLALLVLKCCFFVCGIYVFIWQLLSYIALSFCLKFCAQVAAEGWMDGPPLPLPFPCLGSWGGRRFQAC